MSHKGVVRVLVAAVCALGLLLSVGGAVASADVQSNASGTVTGSGATVTLPGLASVGAGRLLVVGIASSGDRTVQSVTYAGQALARAAGDSQVPRGRGTRAEIWTLQSPLATSGSVVVTFSGSADSVVGAVNYVGVDTVAPLFGQTWRSQDTSANSSNLTLGDSDPEDAMFDVLALANTTNTSVPNTAGTIDLVTPTRLWGTTSGAVHGAGATRQGNTGQNQSTVTATNWRWSFVDPAQRNPYTEAAIGINAAGAAVAPALDAPTATAVTPASATLGGTITGDGGAALTERGVVYCAAPCTPSLGAPGATKAPAAGTTVGTFTVPVAGLAENTAYAFRAYATNRVGTGYSPLGAVTTTRANRAPVASAGGPYTAVEGSGATFDASGSSDPDGDALTYAWDIDGDGGYDDATGATPTLSGAQLAAIGLGDGPDSATVRVRVSDADLSTVSASTTLTIANVAPSITVSDDGPVVEGSDATLTASGATDPSAADAAAGVRYAYDFDADGIWDVGGTTYATATTATSATFPTFDDGTRAVRVAAVDKDGGLRIVNDAVTVTGTAPSATLGNDGPVVEGSDATVTFTGAGDASPADVAAGFRYAYDLDGDGTWDVGDGTYAGGVTAAGRTLPTADDGTITVRAAVIDKDGETTVQTTSVVVANGAPVATVTAPGTTPIDAELSFALTAADPSTADAAAGFTYDIDWGDGKQETVTGPAAATAKHTYTTPGAHTVRVVAADKDGGTSVAATAAVTIPARPEPPKADPPATGTTATPAPAPVAAASTPALARIEGLTVSPRCVAAATATTRSVKIRYRLSTAATVRVTLQRGVGGKAVRRCPPARGSQQADGRYKAGKYTPVTSKQTSGGAGGASLTIAKSTKNGAVGTIAAVRPQALLAKGRRLVPGTYLLTVTALGADGKPVHTARVKFWVLKR